MKQWDTRDHEDQKDTHLSQGEQNLEKLSPKMLSNTSVPEVDEDWGNQLWEVVKKHKEKRDKSQSHPLRR